MKLFFYFSLHAQYRTLTVRQIADTFLQECQPMVFEKKNTKKGRGKGKYVKEKKTVEENGSGK